MTGFITKLVFAIFFVFMAKYVGDLIQKLGKKNEDRPDSERAFTIRMLQLARGFVIFMIGFNVLWAFVGTSMVWVSTGNIATLKRVYFGKSLQPGRIVALDGELGPQARILTAGFHWEPFITITHKVDEEPVFTVPNGQCAVMSAKDGQPISGGSAFAAPWADETKHKMVNDATYFLTEGKGQRGPQTTVLTPGSYTINPFLWEKPKLIGAQRVEQGTVGVVKSSVLAQVDFGSFKRPAPESNDLKVLSAEKLPKGAAAALLVPVGAIGVWEEPLPNGLYYINTEAYRVTMVPTTAQVNEYKGGYKRRTVDVSVNDQGQIVERINEVDVIEQPNTADAAILTKPEGWDVPQEARVINHVSPELAPYVVASLGLTQANAAQIIEDRVVTPIIRSVLRDVLGGAQIPFKSQKAVVDDKGVVVLDEKNEPKTTVVSEFRAVKVMDLLENRASLEEAMELRAKPEALKEGVTIMEIRLSESAIPAELLIARKREQLAQQLTKAWQQEEIAQKQRQLTENARAQAQQQSELVKAEIAAKAAKERQAARTTEGEGEKAYLLAIAEGQKAQSEILGAETTARLQMFQAVLKTAEGVLERNPELIGKSIDNAHKFVPHILVNGGGAGLEGPAAIFGQLLNGKFSGDSVSPDAPAKR